MVRLEMFDREIAAHLIRDVRRRAPGKRSPAWVVCLFAARRANRAGDVGAAAAIRSVAIKFPITLGVS